MKTENKEKQKCNPVRQRAKQFERKLNTKEGEVREKKTEEGKEKVYFSNKTKEKNQTKKKSEKKPTYKSRTETWQCEKNTFTLCIKIQQEKKTAKVYD